MLEFQNSDQLQTDLALQALPALTEKLKQEPNPHVSGQSITWSPYSTSIPKTPKRLTQDYLWPVRLPNSLRLSPLPTFALADQPSQTIGKYLQSGDYVIAETGTSAYGIPLADLTSKPNVHMISQVVFGSIGWATGTAVGSFVAGQEPQNQSLGIKRNILITGEGSLQLTVQGFSDLMRHNLGATMSVPFLPPFS